MLGSLITCIFIAQISCRVERCMVYVHACVPACVCVFVCGCVYMRVVCTCV